MLNPFNWIIDHRQSISGASLASIIGWLLGKRNEWKERRRVKAERQLEAIVLDALQKPNLWPMHGFAGAYPCVRSAELAVHLGREQDAVADCLERLQARGRVKKSGGSFNDPSPTWFFLPR
jgi:hypothetical protein